MKKIYDLLRRSSPNRDSAHSQQAPAAAPEELDEEIPRYPPFAKGLPTPSPDRLLQTQEELLARIRQTAGLPPEMFQSIVLPVLQRYAAFVHLLPASEAHHHRGAGGLLRHGMETAFFAAQAAEGVYFTYGETPKQRRAKEQRWRVGVCLAGLLHDIGKPVSDVAVTNRDGTETWNPYVQTLLDWASSRQINRYFLRWRERRGRRHEQFSVLVMERVLPEATISWLTETGPEVMQAVLEGITGAAKDHPVGKLVSTADSTSVERDLRRNHLDVNAPSLGVPVEQYILDAARRLVNGSEWLVNQKGARVWLLDDGHLYVVWKQAAADIVTLLASDKVPGIPQDPDTLADILFERGLAVRQPESEARYWSVSPDSLAQSEGKRITLPMLRLSSPSLLFSEPPPPVNGLIGGIPPEAPAGVHMAPAKPAAQSEPAPAAPAPKKAATSTVGSAQEQPALAPAPAPSMREPPPIDARPPAKPTESAESTDGNVEDEDAPRTDATEDVFEWLKSQATPASELLASLLRDIGDGAVDASHAFHSHGKCFGIQYPGILDRYGKPMHLLRSLTEAGWAEPDPLNPVARVRQLGNVAVIVLPTSVSKRIEGAVALRKHSPSPQPEKPSAEPPRMPAAKKEGDTPKREIEPALSITPEPDARADQKEELKAAQKTPGKKSAPLDVSGEPSKPPVRKADHRMQVESKFKQPADEFVRLVQSNSLDLPEDVSRPIRKDGYFLVRQAVLRPFATARNVSHMGLRVELANHRDVVFDGTDLLIKEKQSS